jgi:NADH:ubiquinone reductase (non-electrogenic)
MATSSRALSKLPMPAAGIARTQSPVVSRLLTSTTRRAYATRPALRSRPTIVARQFRRGYADEAAAAPAAKKPKRFRVWRWSWRLIQLSLIGGVAYVGYEIYQDRNPEPQVKPDPSKKTLVVLGKLIRSGRGSAHPAPPFRPPF